MSRDPPMTTRTHWRASETGEPELVQETMSEPNLEQRITAAANAYSAIMREALELVWDVDVALLGVAWGVADSIIDSDAAVQNTAAILRDYFRRPEGE